MRYMLFVSAGDTARPTRSENRSSSGGAFFFVQNPSSFGQWRSTISVVSVGNGEGWWGRSNNALLS